MFTDIRSSRGVRAGGKQGRGEASACSSRLQTSLRSSPDEWDNGWWPRATKACLSRSSQRLHTSVTSNQRYRRALSVSLFTDPSRRDGRSLRGTLHSRMHLRCWNFWGFERAIWRTSQKIHGRSQGGTEY